MASKETIVTHLVWIASENPGRPGDKQYAWSEAKRYAAMSPDWTDIPERLTARMKEPSPC